MALDHVLAAVKTRWDARSLGDTVTGGIHDRRGKNLVAPYVVLSTVANTVVGRSSDSAGTGHEYVNTQLQFLLVHRGGPAAAATVKNTVRNAFDWASLGLSTGDLLYCRFVSELNLDDPEDPGNPNAVLWAVMYDVLMSESETLSPS